MKMRVLGTIAFIAVVNAGVIVVDGCTKTQGDLAWTVLKDTTGAICPLVLQATDPALAPLCVGVSELETVIQELTAAQIGADAGTAGQSAIAAAISPDILYQAVLAHRRAEAAKAVK